MSLLHKYTTPAEVARGCKWADRFESEAAVEENNGTVTGSPTFTLGTGVDLTGTDYIIYDLCKSEFNSDPISIIIEFTPDFAADEYVNRYLFQADDGAGSSQTRLFHYASNSDWRLYIGGTAISFMSEAAVAAAWLQNERNVIIISGTSGSTDMWLNGTALVSTDSTSWNPQDDIERLIIGATHGGGNKFDGTFHSFKVLHTRLTAQEAQDYYDQTTYDYINDAAVNYQMRMEDHRLSHVIGSNLITNGTFDSDLSGWDDISTGSEYIEWGSGGTMNLVSSGAAYAKGEQSFPTVASTTYRLEFDLECGVAHGRVYVGSSSGNGDLLTRTGLNSGHYVFEFTATNGTSHVHWSNGWGVLQKVDNVTIREITDAVLDSVDDNYYLKPEHSPPKHYFCGYDLDGANDYLYGSLPSAAFGGSEVSIAMEFTPHFAYNENTGQAPYLFDTSPSSPEYLLYRTASGSSYTLQLYLGGTQIVNLASASYSPWWRKNERNVIVISGKSGDTSMWLNKKQILANDSSAWTASSASTLYLGGYSGGGSTYFFDGIIHKFLVFPFAVTPLQAVDVELSLRRRIQDV
jgi:hypothetical protein